MQLNGVVFPAPECSYSSQDFPGELIFIPRNFVSTPQNQENRLFGTEEYKDDSSEAAQNTSEKEFIPCLFLPYMSTDSQLQNEIKYQIETEQGFL